MVGCAPEIVYTPPLLPSLAPRPERSLDEAAPTAGPDRASPGGEGPRIASRSHVANVLGIDLTQIARVLEGTESVTHAPASRVDPRATDFGRELYATMVRNARAERAGPTEVASARTPLSGTQAASALQSAYTRLFGSAPSSGTMSVLVAQWSHETGGGASMLNYNFGGLKGKSPTGLTTAYMTHEGSGADVHKMVAHFRAYESAADGATDYLRLLAKRFPDAMEAAQRGDAAGFVHSLKQAGYFTDSEASYTRSVCALTERARTHGYDAVGRTPQAGSTESLSAVASHEQVRAPNPTAAVRASAVDSTSMSDELARAALRIAAGDTRNEES